MNKEKLFEDISFYVETLFKEESPRENVYHDLTHTYEVVEAVKKIGLASDLSEDEIEIVSIAAWFHDTGYVVKGDGHESISAENARYFLKNNQYPQDKIEKVADCIMATKIPHTPKNLLEEVICDADLHHLGRKSFFERNELFRVEFELKSHESLTEIDWLNKNISFFFKHKFFTEYARNKYEEQKHLNLMKLQKKLRKHNKQAEQEKLKDDKLVFEKEKLAKKMELDKQATRGIETMFRNTMRTHVSFSSMADNKANIMISVNTLLITVIVSIMIRKLDSNPHLIIPTAILTTISLVTLIFAILVTRPSVTQGTFSKEEIKSKRANLLFFGNFFNMNLQDFTWGMKELINDKDYLYDSMIKDFYFLGQVLGQKYKYLRICYSIFMYGLIVSVIAFAIAFALYPGGTNIGPLID
ncbi:MAG: HD domain-containing protein [Bacteroidetes bacterium]|nr:HD domain-containing protein [Bacteroidota bacterium]